MLGLNAAIIDVENTKLSKTSHIQQLIINNLHKNISSSALSILFSKSEIHQKPSTFITIFLIFFLKLIF